MEPAAPRPRDDEVRRAGQRERQRARRTALPRARQDRRRLTRRHPARRRGHRVRDRHPAPAQGRVHRGRRRRHRRLLAAPAARRRRGHHPVQLPGDDPAVEGRPRARVRQRVHPQAQRARPVGAGPAGRVVPRGRPAQGRLPGGARRQGGRRRHPQPPRHPGRRLRRQLRHRAVHLLDGRGQRQARAVLRRRQEPHDRDARRRSRPGRRRTDRRGLRQRRRALHGDQRRGAGRRGDCGPLARAGWSSGSTSCASATASTPRPTTAHWSPPRHWPG